MTLFAANRVLLRGGRNLAQVLGRGPQRRVVLEGSLELAAEARRIGLALHGPEVRLDERLQPVVALVNWPTDAAPAAVVAVAVVVLEVGRRLPLDDDGVVATHDRQERLHVMPHLETKKDILKFEHRESVVSGGGQVVSILVVYCDA